LSREIDPIVKNDQDAVGTLISVSLNFKPAFFQVAKPGFFFAAISSP
jgi:hypothetical protein